MTEFCLTFTTSCTFSTQSIVPKSPSPLWRMIDHIPFEYRLSTSSPSSRSGPIKTTSNNAFQQPASLRPSVCRSVIFLHTHSLTLLTDFPPFHVNPRAQDRLLATFPYPLSSQCQIMSIYRFRGCVFRQVPPRNKSGWHT